MHTIIPLKTSAFIVRMVFCAFVLLIALDGASLAAAPPEKMTIFMSHNAASVFEIDHSQFTEFLEKNMQYTASGQSGFDYGNISDGEKKLLKSYLDGLQGVNITNHNRDEQLAFWLNLYNAVVIDLVLDFYPLQSFGDIERKAKKKPWHLPRVTVASKSLHLDNIEHDIIRKFFPDWRVHTVFYSASLSSSPLAKTPFSGEQLDSQLEMAAKIFMSHPRIVSIDGNILRISSVFQWYEEDFGDGQEAIFNIIRNYAPETIVADISKITEVEYFFDWSLDDIAKIK